MQPIYEHKQFGLAIWMFLIIPALLFIAILASQAALLPLLVILLFLLVVIVIFSSLTVQVDPRRVTLWFGLHAFHRSFPLEEISGVQVVRNTWLDGLGIHFIRKGLVYNVSGLGAVEIQLRNGRRVRIGSDEPQDLARAIERAKRR
ncbi:MAG TPA: hypothetical protein PKM21_14340 [Anaerolineales bacterium]|nr:hypothetical protein [Anaerolineales bacterium]